MTWTIAVKQGGSLLRRLTFTNDDGTAINTTGWVWRAGLRGSYVQLPVEVRVISINQIEVYLPNTQTALIEPGVYTLGIDWTDARGMSPEEEITADVRISRDSAR